MKKWTILLTSLALILTLGCDDEEQAEVAEESAEELIEELEAQFEEAEEEAAAMDEETEEAEEAAAVAEDGEISITATANSFEPSMIEAPAGEELTISFTREVDTGCMTEVVFPDLDIEEELPHGETVTVAVTPEEGQEINFECGMGMGKSTITGT